MGKSDAAKWLEKKQRIISKYGNKCAYCGCDITIDKFQIDHIVPKRSFHPALHGGNGLTLDHIDNLNPTCCSCNNYKSGNPLEVFRSEIEQQIVRLRRDRPTFRLAERYGLITCTPVKVEFYFEKFQRNGK